MMNKTLLASAVALLFAAPTVSAIDLYKDSKTDVNLGGYIGVRAVNTDSETQLVNGSSRINFNFSRQLTHGWHAYSTLEWGFEPFGDTELVYNRDSQFSANNDNVFYSRLAYIGLEHDRYGSLSFGKQWAAWYNVVGGTDNAYVWGGAAGGAYSLDGSGGIDGTGRADKAIQYSNSFGRFSFTLQTQLQQNTIDVSAFDSDNVNSTLEYDDTYGASITYAITDDLSISAGANRGSFTGFNAAANQRIDTDDEIYGASVTWGNVSDVGWYVSANYNKNKFHDSDINGHLMPSAYGIETMISYMFDSGLQTYALFNGLISDEDYTYPEDDGSRSPLVTESKQQEFILGAAFIWDPTILAYIEAQIDDSKYKVEGMPETTGEDAVAVGIRYTF
ncbi:porin [Shewanella submarina]|uniref:Porin n=1 Tax=Shewanella submarina TaxID=2016376 RepID=A0ABV7GD06_9GAMM|nr:porin [Shewanella submarina]MCL1039164.1 porin [Shewanella submarina]